MSRALKQAALAALLLLSLGWGAWAAGPTLTLPWHNVASGGGTSRGGSYTLHSSIGQEDGGGLLRGGGYTLAGGFIGGPLPASRETTLFLPQVVR